MGFFSSLFGGKSKTSDVNYPDWYADPKFTGSQDFLDTYSRDMLTKGPNDYYAPIGNYGTPEFMDFMRQSNASTLAGVDEAISRGRGRGGRTGEVAAQALGDKNAKLAWMDYLRAMQGREMFLNTGLNVQDSVRSAGFANQGARNQFNVGKTSFDFNKAVYGDTYDANRAKGIGKVVGTLAPLAGAAIGGMAGGVPGAQIGYGIGSSLFGGDGEAPQWLDLIAGSKSKSTPTETGGSAGVSSIGKAVTLDQDIYSNMFPYLNKTKYMMPPFNPGY